MRNEDHCGTIESCKFFINRTLRVPFAQRREQLKGHTKEALVSYLGSVDY